MKKCLFLLMAFCFSVQVWAGVVPKDAKTFAVENIIWHGQSALEVRDEATFFADRLKEQSLVDVRAGVTVFADPYKLTKSAQADIILITHPHKDHLSPEDIKMIQTPDTVIVAPDDPDCRKKLTGDVRFIKPGETITVKGIVIEAVPAYNTGFLKLHKKTSNWLGFIFTVDGVRIYTAGDTDRVPEMRQMKADIAFLPVGGFVTMNPAEAAEAALDINPKVVVPMHYGVIPGSSGNGEKFKKLIDNKLEVLIKPQE